MTRRPVHVSDSGKEGSPEWPPDVSTSPSNSSLMSFR